MNRLKTAALFLLSLPLVVSYDRTRNVPNPVDAISEAVVEATDNISGNLRAGKHLGFDTYAYPGDEAMLAWRQDGAPYELELEMVHSDGRVIWTNARGEVLRDATGRIIKLRGTLQDIAERKQAEAALQQAMAEVSKLKSELEA